MDRILSIEHNSERTVSPVSCSLWSLHSPVSAPASGGCTRHSARTGSHRKSWTCQNRSWEYKVRVFRIFSNCLEILEFEVSPANNDIVSRIKRLHDSLLPVRLEALDNDLLDEHPGSLLLQAVFWKTRYHLLFYLICFDLGPKRREQRYMRWQAS